MFRYPMYKIPDVPAGYVPSGYYDFVENIKAAYHSVTPPLPGEGVVDGFQTKITQVRASVSSNKEECWCTHNRIHIGPSTSVATLIFPAEIRVDGLIFSVDTYGSSANFQVYGEGSNFSSRLICQWSGKRSGIWEFLPIECTLTKVVLYTCSYFFTPGPILLAKGRYRIPPPHSRGEPYNQRLTA